MFTDLNGDCGMDLVVVQREHGGGHGGNWWVDILSGKVDYRDFLMRTVVSADVLRASNRTRWNFTMRDMTVDGRPDLVAIQKSNTQSGKVEVVILGG
jgi:hypothetical protein